MAPLTFHLFPLLPLELRQEIYRLATIARRTISITINIAVTIARPPSETFQIAFSSPDSPSFHQMHPLAHVSHECSEIYHSLTPEHEEEHFQIYPSKRRIHFNCNRDTIHLERCVTAKFDSSPEFARASTNINTTSFEITTYGKILKPHSIGMHGILQCGLAPLTGLYEFAPLDAENAQEVVQEWKDAMEMVWNGIWEPSLWAQEEKGVGWNFIKKGKEGPAYTRLGKGFGLEFREQSIFWRRMVRRSNIL